MIFGNKQCEDDHVVSINGMNIKRVYVTKFLGVHIYCHLNTLTTYKAKFL